MKLHNYLSAGAIFVIGALLFGAGFAGLDWVPELALRVEWLEGFTGHLDGLAMATTAVAGTAIATPEKEDESAEEVRDVGQIVIDGDQFATAIATAVDSVITARIAAEGAERTDRPAALDSVVNDQSARVVAQRDTDGPDGVHVQTHRLFKAIGKREHLQREQVMRHMEKAGMYENHGTSRWQGEERAVSLTGDDGLPFLPTTVDNRIEEIRDQFGIVRRLCTVYNFESGQHKVPNTTGRPPVFAVNEGSIINMRRSAFGSVLLDPKKWGIITGFSTEMSDEVGAQFVMRLSEQIGRSFAEAEDQTVLTADGTAAFHGLTGLLNDGAVAELVLDAGNTAFGNFTYEDGLNLMMEVPVGARGPGASFVFNHDFQLVMAKFKDAAGQYLYPPNSEITRLIRPANFTEAMPAVADSAVSTSFGVFGNFSLVNMGFQRGVTVKLLDQATIKDVDDSTDILLGAQDLLALRFTARWDVKIGLKAGFARITTAAA